MAVIRSIYFTSCLGAKTDPCPEYPSEKKKLYLSVDSSKLMFTRGSHLTFPC